MRQKLAVWLAFVSLVMPPPMFSKAEISKITIKGPDLKTPIEITDFIKFKNVDLNVWAGPGSTINGEKQTEGFILDWSQGARERPRGLQRYEVSFYAKYPPEQLVYVVLYEYDPATERGYIYLPGSGDEWRRLNVGTIIRGVEGRWFRALHEWDVVAGPLILGAKNR